MTNKKIIFVLTLAVVLVIALSAVSCNSTDPYTLWSNSMSEIKRSNSISADINIDYGGSHYSMSTKHNISNSTKAIDIKIAKNNNYKIISDGTTNYYELSGMKYSASAESDNPAIDKILSFSLANAQTLVFPEEFFANAESENGFKTTVTVVANGDDIKEALSPDDEIEFSDITLTAGFRWNKLVSLKFEGQIGGESLYGLPVYESGDAENKTEFSASITNISYSSKKPKLLPKDTSKYPDMPALAQLSTALWLRNLRSGLKYKQSGYIQIPIIQNSNHYNVRTQFASTVVSAVSNGYLTTRTVISQRTLIDGYGYSKTTKIDTFTDGKSDYIYYTYETPEKCYKEIPDRDENDEALTAITAMVNDPFTCQKFYSNAKVIISGSINVIRINLNSEQLKELIELTGKEDITIGNSDKLTLRINIDENGLLDKVTMDITGIISTDMPDYNNGEISSSFEIKFSDIYDDITPDIPEGYEKYPEKSTDD